MDRKYPEGNSKTFNGDIFVDGLPGSQYRTQNAYRGNVSEGSAQVINGSQFGGKGFWD